MFRMNVGSNNKKHNRLPLLLVLSTDLERSIAPEVI